jgi:hypothetical protein
VALPDVVQFVKTFWVIKDQQALIAAKRMQKQFLTLSAIANRTAAAISRVGSALLTPFGVALGGFAAFGLVKHLVDVGREAEKAELNIAALLQQASRESNLPFRDFERAADAAHTLRLRFKEIAVESPATARNIQDAFGATTFFLSQAGISLEKQVEFSRDIAVIEKQLGRSKGTVARDVRQILTGRGSIREIQTPVLQEIAKETAKLAKSGKLSEAAKKIKDKLTPDKRLLDAYKESFEGLTTTMSDRLRFLKEDAAKPIMEFISGKLREWIKWLKENKEKAKEFAQALGRGVVRALKAIISLVKSIHKHWSAIVRVIKTLVRLWLLTKAVGAIIKIIGLLFVLKQAFAAASLSAAGILGPLGLIIIALAAIVAFFPEIIDGFKRISEGFAEFVATKGGRLDKVIQFKKKQDAANLARAEQFASTGKKILEGKALEGKVDLGAPVDPTKRRGFGAGKGRGKMKVRELIVDKMSARDRDFARLSTPAARRITDDSFARRPLAGLGLAVSTTGG